MVKGKRVIDKLFSKEIVEKIDRQNGEIFEDPLLERFLSLELWKDEENPDIRYILLLIRDLAIELIRMKEEKVR